VADLNPSPRRAISKCQQAVLRANAPAAADSPSVAITHRREESHSAAYVVSHPSSLYHSQKLMADTRLLTARLLS
jgi:hypothetical protein